MTGIPPVLTSVNLTPFGFGCVFWLERVADLRNFVQAGFSYCLVWRPTIQLFVSEHGQAGNLLGGWRATKNEITSSLSPN
jgi:hypothetical protein